MSLTARLARFNPHTGLLERFSPSGEVEDELRDEAALVDVALSGEDKAGTFDVIAYSGVPVDRWYGKLVLDCAGMSHDGQTTALLEHEDMRPVGVITTHDKTNHRVRLAGHFLDDDASEDAKRLRRQCRAQAGGRPGLKLKCSVGTRFKKYRFLKEDEEVLVNGRMIKGTKDQDVLLVSEWHLFENSFIYCNPADLSTSAEILRHHGAATMSISKDSATAAVLASNLPAPPAAPAPAAPASAAQVVRLSDLDGDARRRLMGEAQVALEAERKAFADSFPDRSAEWRESMRAGGKTIEQAKLIAYDELAAKKREDEAAAKVRNEVADLLASQTGRDGIGFEPATAERRAELVEAPMQFATNRLAEDMLHKNPAAVYLFGHEALAAMSRAVSCDGRLARTREGGEIAYFPEDACVEAAKTLLSATPLERVNRISRFGSTGGAGGRAALDLSMITVKGFLDSYHNEMEKEDDWGVEICHMLDSNQESEVVRWLGYFPQLAPLIDAPEEAFVPVYSLNFTSIWYDHTIGIDVQDFMLQKFGKINQLMGQAGAVAKRHWNKLSAAQLEANNTGYDKVSLFNTAHALGGKSPVAQSNDLSAANGQTYLGIPDVGNISPAQLNTALQNAAGQLLLYFAANGEPLNEERNRRILVITPAKWKGVMEAAVFSNRLDGFTGGAGGSRDNPLQVEASRRGDKWDVVSSPRLSTPGGANAAFNYFYIALLGNDRKPLLRAEPVGLSMFFAGPGSELHRKQNKYGFWGRTMRAVAPGAWSSILRCKLGA